VADNVTLDAGSGGAVIATDEISSVHFAKSKLVFGADGTANLVTSTATNPLPVALSDTDNAVLDTINTAVELIDDAVYIDDADWTDGTSKHVLIGGVYQSTPQTITDGDVGPLEVTTNGYLIVSVNGTVALGAGTAEFGKLAAGVAEIGNVKNSGTFAVQSTLQAGTAEFGKLAAGVAEIGNVKNAGTFVVQVDGAALTALQLIDNVVITHDAAGGTAVGNMMMGQRDDEVDSTATTTADGDAQALTTNKFGQLKTTQLADANSDLRFGVINNGSSGDQTLLAAQGAGVKIRVLAAFIVSAGTVNARFESGASGTALTGQMNLVANSGFVLPFNPGGWFETGDNVLLNLELSAAVNVDGAFTYVLVGE